MKANVDASAIDGYNPESKKCDVIYDPKTDLLPESFSSINRTVNYIANTANLPSSFSTITRYVNYVKTGSNVSGTAHVGGTARAGGDWGTAPGGSTLVGELGREIVVEPADGIQSETMVRSLEIYQQEQSYSITSRPKAYLRTDMFLDGLLL